MIAAVYQGKESIAVEEVADPNLSAGEVLVEIDACAVGIDPRPRQHKSRKTYRGSRENRKIKGFSSFRTWIYG